MGKCLGGWRTVPGIVLDNASDTLSLDVLAERIGATDVARVEFTITPATGSPIVVDVTSRSLRRPNFTDSTPPLPGAWGGGPIPRWWHGTSIAMSSFAAGRFTVQAVIRGNASGSSSDDYDCGTLVFWNNKAGTLTKGRTVHCDPTNGDDSNDGYSPDTAVATIHQAFLAASNGGEAGGGTVLLYEGAHAWAQAHFNPTTVETTERWLTFQPAPGVARSKVKIRRDENAANWLKCTGTNCWLRFRDVTLVGGGPLVNRTLSTGAGLRFWMDGVRRTNELELTIHSILAYGQYKASSCGDNWGTGGEAQYFTACHWDYVWGFDGFTLVMGCRQSGGGVCLLMAEDDSHASDVLIEDARYYTTSPGIPISGWFDGDMNGQWSATALGGGFFRFRPTFATTGIHDMLAAMPVLQQSTHYGLCLRDWGGVTDGQYDVNSYGTDGTGQYVDLDLAGQTPVHGSNSTVVVGRELSPGHVISFLEEIHPDVAKWEGGARTRSSLDNVRVVDNGGPRGFVGSQTPVSLMLIRSCTDSGVQNDWSGTAQTDCLILGCTFLGSLIVDTAASGCEIRDSYIAGRDFSNITGWSFSGCFYETSVGLSPAGWTQVAQAAALAADPLVKPWNYAAKKGGPLDNAATRGTGSVGHLNGGDAGVSQEVASGDWSAGNSVQASWDGPVLQVISAGTWGAQVGVVASWSGPTVVVAPGTWQAVVGTVASWSGPTLQVLSAGTWDARVDVVASWSGPELSVLYAGDWSATGLPAEEGQDHWRRRRWHRRLRTRRVWGE